MGKRAHIRPLIALIVPRTWTRTSMAVRLTGLRLAGTTPSPSSNSPALSLFRVSRQRLGSGEREHCKADITSARTRLHLDLQTYKLTNSLASCAANPFRRAFDPGNARRRTFASAFA